jgi:protein TonB
MSNVALAYSAGRADARRSRLLRQSRTRPIRTLRPWSEIAVAGTPLQAISGHPTHIKRSYWAILIAVALVLHAGAAWYLAQHSSPRFIEQRKAELNIELVRPPKPAEPPKVEPPKPVPPRPQPQHAQVLPQIQQSTPEPSTAGESSEAPVAVAPVVAAAPEPDPLPITAPIGRAGYLNNPAPDYPALAVRQGWQGTVLLRVRVLSTGKVEAVEVKQSSGRKILDDEAIRTVKQWLFSPSKRGDTAIDGWATVPIEFQLG